MRVFKIIQVLLTILFVSFIAVYCGLIHKTKSILGFSFAVVVGNSMYPTLYDGDFIVIKKNEDCFENDIVCFLDGEDRRIVHRIIQRDENKITTKGDFNNFADLPISADRIIGKVVFKSAFLGFVFRNVHLIIFGIILIVLLKLKNLKKYDKIKL